MDELQRKGRISPDTRVEVARNSMVVIIPVGSGVRISSLTDLATPAIENIAIGDPSHSPAGIYAVECLKNAGIWEEVRGKLLNCLDVRAVLATVINGEAEAGIVYRTDARTSERVSIELEISPELHQPIAYQAAAITDGQEDESRRFIVFMRGSAGRKVLRELGFNPPVNRE